jgi:hypothetical protein
MQGSHNRSPAEMCFHIEYAIITMHVWCPPENTCVSPEESAISRALCHVARLAATGFSVTTGAWPWADAKMSARLLSV